MKAPLTNADKARRSIVFGSHQAERPHSLGREMLDLRDDIEEAFVSLEGCDQIPQIHSLKLDRTNFNNVGNAGLQFKDLVIDGDNFLSGRSVASASIFATGSTANFINLSSIRPGTASNSLSFEAINPGGDNALSVSIAGTKLTISLATAAGAIKADGSNSLTNILNAINAEFDNDFAVATITGAGADEITEVISETSLTGGTGEGLQLVACKQGDANVNLKLSALTDSRITVQTQVIADAAVGDVVGLFVTSHTGKSNICFLPVIS